MAGIFERLNEGRSQQIEEAIEQQRRNADPKGEQLQDLLDKLGNPDAVTLDQIIKAASGTRIFDVANWLTDRKNRRLIPHWLGVAGYVPVRNDARGTGLWVVAGVRQVVYAKKDLLPRDRLKAVTALQHRTDGGRQ
jgi:hypothetical protein